MDTRHRLAHIVAHLEDKKRLSASDRKILAIATGTAALPPATD